MTATSVVQSQLESLDETDCYATAWQRILQRPSPDPDGKLQNPWGGRGRGGRFLARRTLQRRDIVVDRVRLEFSGRQDQGPSTVLLENARLKLLAGQVYALIGRNASGKSTLLKRIQSGRIPGFPRHINTLYIPQEVQSLEVEGIHASDTPAASATDAETADPLDNQTPSELLRKYAQQSVVSMEAEILRLEASMEDLDMTAEEDQAKMEELADSMAALDDEIQQQQAESTMEGTIQEALDFVGLPAPLWHLPMAALSPGHRKRSLLAIPLVAPSHLLLLDEPTNNLDVDGLLMLRDLIETVKGQQKTTILMVSHDHDLMDDVADHVVDFFEKDLLYSPGNFSDYRRYRHQTDLHAIRQALALEKKRDHLLQTLENVKKQPKPKRSKRSKRNKAAVVRKKLEKVGLEKDAHGHRRTNQTAGTAIKTGSINAIDATTRRAMSTGQLRDLARLAPVPDKAVQFIFPPVTSQWGEPLVMALEVGHTYPEPTMPIQPAKKSDSATEVLVTKKEGMLFDCVDFCVEEGQTYCIVGESGCGKSTLLRLLARQEKPTEGTIKHAQNVDLSFVDQTHVDSMIDAAAHETALSYLASRFPRLPEQILRGALSAFGLSPPQASTNVRFLSGGERCRLFLALSSLQKPQLLFLDEPTANFDIESVKALVHGLHQWNGTVVMVCHDTDFIRAVQAKCYALIADEGKLRRVEGGIDAYLQSFAASN